MPLSYTIEPTRKLVTIAGEYSDAEEWKRLLGSVLPGNDKSTMTFAESIHISSYACWRGRAVSLSASAS
jgi:hypothetical protein